MSWPGLLCALAGPPARRLNNITSHGLSHSWAATTDAEHSRKPHIQGTVCDCMNTLSSCMHQAAELACTTCLSAVQWAMIAVGATVGALLLVALIVLCVVLTRKRQNNKVAPEKPAKAKQVIMGWRTWRAHESWQSPGAGGSLHRGRLIHVACHATV
jgi:hypothetical protein